MSLAGTSRRAGPVLLLVLVLLTSGALRGLCFMAGADDDSGIPHACCKRGWQAAPPPCCMSAAAPEAPVRFTTPPPALALLAATAAVSDPDAVPTGSGALDGLRRTHAPPGRSVLRI